MRDVGGIEGLEERDMMMGYGREGYLASCRSMI